MCYNAYMHASHMQRTFAISLMLDGTSSAAVRSTKRKLADTAGAKCSACTEPHITLGMFHTEEERMDEVRYLFSKFTEETRSAFRIDFAGAGSFNEKVIFLSIDNSNESHSEIARLNAVAHDIFLPRFKAGANRNYLPRNFFPHVALATRLSRSGFRKCDELLASIDLPSSARVTAVSLFLCRPYSEISRFNLTPGTPCAGSGTLSLPLAQA